MKIGLKHTKNPLKIAFIESDEQHKTDFLDLSRINGWAVTTYSHTIELIQNIKLDQPDAIVIEEDASPLNAYQTYEYLTIEVKLEVPILVSFKSEDKKERYKQNNLYFIEKKFTHKVVEQINELFIPTETGTHKKYSLDYLNAISDGNLEFVAESLQIFTSSVERKLAEIDQLLATADYKTIGEIAHNIKPSFEMIESETGKNICNLLVYESEANDVPQLIENLKNEFAALQKEISRDFPKLIET